MPCQGSSCKREVPCRGGGAGLGRIPVQWGPMSGAGGLGGGLYSEVQCIMAIDHMGTPAPPRGQNDRFDWKHYNFVGERYNTEKHVTECRINMLINYRDGYRFSKVLRISTQETYTGEYAIVGIDQYAVFPEPKWIWWTEWVQIVAGPSSKFSLSQFAVFFFLSFFLFFFFFFYKIHVSWSSIADLKLFWIVNHMLFCKPKKEKKMWSWLMSDLHIKQLICRSKIIERNLSVNMVISTDVNQFAKKLQSIQSFVVFFVFKDSLVGKLLR